jgi:hypothetical protein
MASLPAAFVTAQEGCTGELECYDLNPTPDFSSAGWPGDDRLNPVPDEYYTIYCHYGQVEVWRAIPSSEMILQFPIQTLVDLTGSQDVGNGLTATRTDDVVTISGANGNGPTHPGSKSFSLEMCMTRGGVSSEEPTATPTPSPRTIVSATEDDKVGETCYTTVYSDGTANYYCEQWMLLDWLMFILVTLIIAVLQFCSSTTFVGIALVPGCWWIIQRRLKSWKKRLATLEE